ncbi:hypothetical protein SAY87_025901 [Trapa incisa]|uniref:RING-type E3 ubiquitin transferase n=1 Tax=Trapa incisa TaxID=236973 RepID=A0AAN7GYU4_9MYRT|nr:hypothetical protein SAY87_025901 [Trapa incisa]
MSFSFAGNFVGGPFPDDGSSLKAFHCHKCNRISSSAASTAFVDLQNPSLFSNPNSAGSASEENLFDLFAFLQGHLQNLRSSGAKIQFVIENRPSSDAQFRFPANFGDYFIGPGLEQLIQQLAENDPNRYGTPPASKSAVEALPTVRITDEILNSEMNQCAVCQDDFEKDMEVKQMPCTGYPQMTQIMRAPDEPGLSIREVIIPAIRTVREVGTVGLCGEALASCCLILSEEEEMRVDRIQVREVSEHLEKILDTRKN